ncbi:cation/H(+) antiporter 28-like [Salvia hispanica]|uniref:cation/H(+) antiporter 28-like n=1 Tax=Salvia hispanica TaxID=49212 RepID=UPI002008F66A|nr:cation/H(+) antiporter 28-like [Salvia hispanica]
MDIGNLKNMTNAALCTNGSMTFRLATVAVYMLGFFFIVFLCNFLHIFLRRLSQPRIFSECIVGLFLSNLPMIRKHTKGEGIRNTIEYIVEVAMVLHMFVVGLEVDPNIFLEIHLPEAKVAYSAILTTFVMASFLTPFLDIPETSSVPFNLCLSVIISGTASPLLTRLITDLKIGKSDIGRFVVSAGIHTDLVATLLICIGFIIFDPLDGFYYRSVRTVVSMVSLVAVEVVVAAKVTPLIMNWVNRENPEGKPMKCSHLVLAVAYVVMLCSFSPLCVKYNKILSSFLAGVFMPRDGRIAKMMIIQVNYFFNAIFYPLFFFWVGTEAQFKQFQAGKLQTWARIAFVFLIATFGKVIGAGLSGVMLGLHWQDSVATGLLLNIKGHFHVYLAIMATNMNYTSISTSLALVFTTLLTVVYTPLVVSSIIRRARRHAPTQRMALQWLNPSSELRVLMCVRGTQHVGGAANLMAISRGPLDPGILVHLTDMVELTDRIAATLAHNQSMDAVTVTDPTVVEMREQITTGVNAYLDEDGDGITTHRMLALSTLNNMHQDVCILAEDLSISLIVLPFHKQQEPSGRLDLGHAGFRHVNRKILRHAPCSVGILVDRGLGATALSRSAISLYAAVIFIGGKDDREALAFAGRVACHSGVKLTVIRFLLEAAGDSVSSIVTMARANTAEHQEEMKVDDECFADFYDRHVAGGHVAYMEKYLSNSGQAFSTLRSLEAQYGLFIVGRGGRVNSLLTVGMNDWEECPELGPIGDILSASDFSATASVMVIQQHSLKGELDGLQEEFSIM